MLVPRTARDSPGYPGNLGSGRQGTINTYMTSGTFATDWCEFGADSGGQQ